jgi:hypothetical protein
MVGHHKGWVYRPLPAWRPLEDGKKLAKIIVLPADAVDRILEWSQFRVLTWGQMELPSERDVAKVCSFCGRFVGAAVNSVGFAFQLHDRGAVHDAVQ